MKLERAVLLMALLAVVAPLPRLAAKPLDLCPGLSFRYRVDGGWLNLTLTPPSAFSERPIMAVSAWVSWKGEERYLKGRLDRLSRELACKGLEGWRYIPLFIPEGLNVGDGLLLYESSKFTVLEVRACSFLGEPAECVVLSNGTDVLAYDRLSGVLVEGDLRLMGAKVRAKLVQANLERRVEEFRLYHDWEGLTQLLKEINGSAGVLVRSIGRSALGREIWAAELNPEGRRLVVVEAGIHGTELVTVEAAVYLLLRLARMAEVGDLLSFLRDRDLCIAILPMVNPDGVEVAEILPDSAWLSARVNARLVDLNRNFPYAWANAGSFTIGRYDYRGPYPGSEPEARALMDYLSKREVALYVALHSGIELVMAPANLSLVPLDTYEATLKAVEKFSSVIGYRWIVVGSYGASKWWVHAARSAPAFLVELYEGGRGGGFARYNPRNPETLKEVCRKFSDAFIELLYSYDEVLQREKPVPKAPIAPLLLAVLLAGLSTAAILLLRRLALSSKPTLSSPAHPRP